MAIDIENRRKYQREWVRNLPIAKRQHRNLLGNRRRFGLTPEQYTAKLASQNGLCGMCGEPFSEVRGRTPSLDHVHGTKPVRLRDFCHATCNAAIGFLYDNPDLCIKAAEYLKKHQ